ncbi:uncharacterized protein LOC121735578 [Aricia agestis]|uniref:uncharacterized protein LOC121735578 n=1 Tax=Aricia agestis TaxID=91739 RepID=UPI001C20B45B|nr:uncharacterized protein LOC121735578 [Aricia agestis]
MAIPVMRVWCATLAVLLLAGHSEARNITNEDIRDAMLSLVHMFRTSEDKLERHEYREKALGEQLKKMMAGLEKKHRALEPLKGMISRLDERLYNVENIFLQKEEKEKVSQKKTNEVLADIQKSLQTLTDIVVKLPTNVAKRLDDTDAKLAALHTDVAAVKSLLDNNSRALCQESENPLERHISEAEKLLNKYELKLNEYGNASRVQTDFVPLSEVSLADEAWHSKMTEVMERQERDIKKIQQLLGDAESMWKDLPRLSDLNKYTNQTLDGIAALQRNLTEADEKSVARVTAKLRDMGDRLLATNEDIQASLTQGNTMSERAYNDIQRSYDALRLEVQTFSKNEHLLQSIADETNSTKKRIEYGIHNILMEIRELTRVQGDLLNMTINERFDNTEALIMGSQAGGFKNLSSKIEGEMTQVWRQIGTMYQQLSATKATLDKLTEQTAQYVNGSAATLDGIKTKVGQVSDLTAEVQENVNYFVGKVSLLSQEFGHIKESLGAALDEATTNLKDAKTEINNGPGPHVAKPAA